MQGTIGTAVRDNYGQLARASNALDADKLAAVETSFHDGISDFFRDVDLNAYAASVKIFVVKPR
jgi:hypothetical protein